MHHSNADSLLMINTVKQRIDMISLGALGFWQRYKAYKLGFFLFLFRFSHFFSPQKSSYRFLLKACLSLLTECQIELYSASVVLNSLWGQEMYPLNLIPLNLLFF